MATREQVMVALFERLRSRLGDIEHTGREYVDINSLPAEKQTALMVLADQYVQVNERGRPPVWTIQATIVVYARLRDGDDTAETRLNEVIDAVEQVLLRGEDEAIKDMSSPYHTTLGGLCSKCWINGPVDVITGDIAGQAAAMIPVEILMP